MTNMSAHAALPIRLGVSLSRTLRDPAIRSGIKFGLAAVLAFFVAQLIRLESPQWSVITVIVLMPAQFAGAVAEKAFFRVVGTILGGLAGYFITASLEQSPLIFLTMVVLCVGFGVMMFGQPHAPYAFFLFALTVIVVAGNGMANPADSWRVALARTEEVFLGVVVSVLVSALVWPRFARLEFQKLFSDSLCRQTDSIISAINTVTSGSPAREPKPFDLMPLRNLVHFGSRESRFFNERLPTYSRLVSGIASLAATSRRLSAPRVLEERYRSVISADLLAFANALGNCTKEVQSGRLPRARAHLANARSHHEAALRSAMGTADDQALLHKVSPSMAFDLSAILIETGEAQQTMEGILSLLESLPQHPQSTSKEASEQPEQNPPMDPFWITNGLRCGLTVAIALVVQNWLNPPGGSMVTLAAFVFSGLTRLYPGGQGDLRAFQYSGLSAIGGIFYVLASLLLVPVLSDYAAFNTLLFAALFLFGFLSFLTPGFAFSMQIALLSIIGTVALNPQVPVTFPQIIGVYFGVILGMLISALTQRLLWPVLPQKEVLQRIREGLDHAIWFAGDRQASAGWRRLRIAVLPSEMRAWICGMKPPACPHADRHTLEDVARHLGHLNDELLSLSTPPTISTPEVDSLHATLRSSISNLLTQLVTSARPSPASPSVSPDAFSLQFEAWENEAAALRQKLFLGHTPVAQRFAIYARLDRHKKAAEAALHLAISLRNIIGRPCLGDPAL
ncbi:MAG: hypothetical protein Fur0032_03680 [Terrimicrobiaceae bacterium]